MEGNKTASLSAFTTWLETSHWTTLPLAYHGISEILFTTCTASLPGLKLQIDGGKKLLQLFISGSSNPLIELGIHGRSRLQNTLRKLQRFLSLFAEE